MSHARLSVTLLTLTGTLCGFAVAYRWPSAPLLVYWLLLAVVLGMVVSFLLSIGEIQRRLRWLVWIYAVLIGVSLITTQVAARRAISSTHLVYSGVHLVGLDSFTVGSGSSGADVRLATISSAQIPWLLRVRRTNAGWELESLSGVEQLRVRQESTLPIEQEFTVARSALLQLGDSVDIAYPSGETDTLRLVQGGLHTATGTTLSFEPTNQALRARYRRRVTRGTALANLDGTRSAASSVYERFVRVQQVSNWDVVNGNSVNLPARLLPTARRYLISAAPPYTLRGDTVSVTNVVVRDSAFVEVRNGDTAWRFVLLADWRREPSAPRGVTVLFRRNPRPLDTPLPVGISCDPGAACGAISLRRLPPPVAHVTLDEAGFDPERFGLLGMLRLARDGYEVLTPRRTYYVQRGGVRPVAVPVTPLDQDATEQASTRADESRWILLEASGDRDNILKVTLIGSGLALLLVALQSAVRMVTIRDAARLTPAQTRAIAVGLTALLGLILTRVTVGARVAFFDPFLDRAIETAVGLCTAIAIVVVALLTWSSWLPPFIASASSAFAGQVTLASIVRSMWRRIFGRKWVQPQAVRTVALAALSLALLTLTTGLAPWQGMFTGVVVVLVWVCVAWVAAFTGHHIDTYERGAHSVIEQSAPQLLSDGMRPFLLRTPELSIMGAFGALTLAHMVPWSVLITTPVIFLAVVWVVWWRRHRTAPAGRPDYIAAGFGVAVFAACLAVLRTMSENGSLGALVLVVFVALASVRIGRGVGARLETRSRLGAQTGAVEWLLDALLLTAPLFLLLPLAGIDMGLGLVLVIPLGFATLLATGVRTAGWRLVVPLTAMMLLLLLAWKVVFPPLGTIRHADSHSAQAAAFASMPALLGVRIPLIDTPMDRAAARAVATRDRALAEALLVAAAPGPARDLLLPSIEQIWGAKAYASAGELGEGLGRAAIGNRGVAEAVSYAENTFAVFILAEHGAVGGLLVLLLYVLLSFAVAKLALGRASVTPSYRATRTLFLIAALIVAIPACYVALSNLGMVPITGQNMPFLGLNAWSDVAISAGVIGILITGTLRALQEPDR